MARLEKVVGRARAADIGRYAIVNVWRSMDRPIVTAPLAVLDATSVGSRDLVDAEVRYPYRTGHIFLLRHAARHRWTYFPAMRADEALVFKQHDSQVSGVARFTPHAAFDHPETPADASSQTSIEARCLVVYD